MFSKNVGFAESNEVEMVAIRETLRFLLSASFKASVIVESEFP